MTEHEEFAAALIVKLAKDLSAARGLPYHEQVATVSATVLQYLRITIPELNGTGSLGALVEMQNQALYHMETGTFGANRLSPSEKQESALIVAAIRMMKDWDGWTVDSAANHVDGRLSLSGGTSGNIYKRRQYRYRKTHTDFAALVDGFDRLLTSVTAMSPTPLEGVDYVLQRRPVRCPG